MSFNNNNLQQITCEVLRRGDETLEGGHGLWPFNLIESDGGLWEQATAQMIIFSYTCPGLRGPSVMVTHINAKLILKQLQPSSSGPISCRHQSAVRQQNLLYKNNFVELKKIVVFSILRFLYGRSFAFYNLFCFGFVFAFRVYE